MGSFPAPALVVLENLPGSLAQLQLLASIAERLLAQLALVELTASDDLLTARARLAVSARPANPIRVMIRTDRLVAPPTIPSDACAAAASYSPAGAMNRPGSLLG